MLAEANARATAANQKAAEALEQVASLEANLRETSEREASLANLLTTAGYSALSLAGIDWTTDDARKCLEEEALAMQRVDELLSKVRDGSSAVRGMIEQQDALRRSLDASLSRSQSFAAVPIAAA